MLTPYDRSVLKKSRIARFYEMERQFELVTSFYPAQRLMIFVDMFSIQDIMNCTSKEASAILKKVTTKAGDPFDTQVRTDVFCDIMKVDPMLIQVFLASMNLDDLPLPPRKRLPPLTREQIENEKPRSFFELQELLKDGILENTQTLALRAKIYDEQNPDGELCHKRVKWVQMVIRAFEVAQIYGCHIRTAQQMLQEVREEDKKLYPGMKQRRYVSISRFCFVHNEPEENLRKHLAHIHIEDDDDKEDN